MWVKHSHDCPQTLVPVQAEPRHLPGITLSREGESNELSIKSQIRRGVRCS